MTNAKPENRPEMEELVEEEKRQRVAKQTEEGEAEEDKDFVSAKAKDIWTKVLADKGFVYERGFGKLISLFSKIIKIEVGRAFVRMRHLDSLLWPGNSTQIWRG